jgi:hypothetical protein
MLAGSLLACTWYDSTVKSSTSQQSSHLARLFAASTPFTLGRRSSWQGELRALITYDIRMAQGSDKP